MKKRVLFIDRDGTLILEPEDLQVDAVDKVRFYPGAIRALASLREETDYRLVMVTNQDGLGTESFPEADFEPPHRLVVETFAGEGVKFDAMHVDRTFEHEGAATRKPGTGMLKAYFSEEYDLEGSFVIGDRMSDLALAANLGAKAVLIGNPNASEREQARRMPHCALVTDSWEEIHRLVKNASRRARIERKTKETTVRVALDLEGGPCENNTGVGFLDHMLDQLAKHGGFGLQVSALGDLHIDAHHTIEDVALTLGQAFRQALADKRGIGRYGHALLPMDEALAQIALDFGGRPFLVWDAPLSSEKIGDFPCQMAKHFFKSFSDAAACNLNVKAQGENDHHIVEAVFKAFAKSLKMAVARTGGEELPTTKGAL